MENQERRDRKMQFVIDSDLQAVLEFMQRRIVTCKLVGIAEALPQVARLLWGHHPQEPFNAISLLQESATTFAGRLRSDASECVPVQTCVDGDSAEEACV